MSEMELKPFDTINALARVTGLSTFMLRQWVREGRLPYVRSGKKYLINTVKALKMLDEDSQKTANMT